jgi:hypothetical protein
VRFIRDLADRLSEHRVAALAGCIFIILVVIVIIVRSVFSSGITMPAAYPVWLYDENTDRLYVGSSHDIPPVAAPSKSNASDGRPAGVRAYVFGCGRCDEVGRVVVYLERFTPDAQDAMRDLMRARVRGETNRYRELQQRVEAGREVRTPETHIWASATDVVGRSVEDDSPINRLESILNSFSDTCERMDARVKPCSPD